ncbi:MAG TPA: hypothetical protein VLX92_24925 [Kofleriaceae bacterium]|nr:hypothetical protein [Kofleriaceae bacterium]
MLRRHVLAALARGIEAADDDAARAAVTRGDWVLRGAARRRLERALIDAALSSGELASAADPDAMRHVQRVAALDVAGRYDVDSTDRARVAAAYEALPLAAVPRAPVATIAALARVALVAAALAWSVVRLRARPQHDRPPPPPPVAGAFFHGGTPERDAGLEHLFGEDLTRLVIATDADRRTSLPVPERARSLAALGDAPAIVVRGLALAAAWDDLLDALDRWDRLALHTSRAPKDVVLELRRRAREVSAELAAQGLGYYLEAAVTEDRSGDAHAAIFAYRVERVAFARVRGAPRRVLELRRIDRLNLAHALLGMESEELGDPVVLLDQVDEFVASHVEPVLAGAPYELGDAGFRATPWGGELAAAAGDAVRRELAWRHDTADVVVATVLRHEARHGVDQDREDDPLREPAPLAALIGRDDTAFVLRARAELAAYLSQIANDPVTPQLALWNLASKAFQHERWGSAESYAAVVVIAGLSGRGDAVRGGQLDRAALARAARPLADLSDDALRAAAGALWLRLYGEPLVVIE